MFKKIPFREFLFWLITITTIIRCLLAFYLNLGNDEVYYFTYAIQPDWNHFDHPPLTGVAIRIFTLNLTWINGLSMRLPAILGAAVSTLLIAKCGQIIRNERTGIIAALFYNVSIYASIISGLFILPDSIQIVFWLASVLTMLKIVKNDSINNNFQILSLGFWIGLAMMCKVHGAFLWLGFLGYILLNNRKLLSNPYLYFSIVCTMVLFSPVIFWNIGNNFITWRFHSARVIPATTGLNLSSLFTTLAGQIAYNNPALFIIHVSTLNAVFRGETGLQRKFVNLLMWCALPIIIATTMISIIRPALPHWSGPGFIALILLSASYTEKMTATGSKYLSGLMKIAFGLIVFVVVAGFAVIKLYPGTPGNTRIHETGHGDATLDLTGWELVLPAFRKIKDRDIQDGRMKPDAALIVNKWFPAGHLYFYVAYPLGMDVIGTGDLNDLHKFAWLNRKYGYLSAGESAYFISPSNYFSDPAKLYHQNFRRISLAQIIPQFRNGKLARQWYVYRLENANMEMGLKL